VAAANFFEVPVSEAAKSVITDADAAMIRAIREVLPDVWHHISTWHIEKNEDSPQSQVLEPVLNSSVLHHVHDHV
jgi:hypothetical protein